MSFNKTSLVRQLVPKSYHFDGYNEINCPNSRDKPFFSDNVIPMGEYYLSIRLVNQNMISLEYSSICSYGKITFQPYALSLDSYISKLKTAIQEGSDFITFEIQPEYDVDSNFCSRCSEKNEDCIQLRKNLPKKVLAAVSFNTINTFPSDIELNLPNTLSKSSLLYIARFPRSSHISSAKHDLPLPCAPCIIGNVPFLTLRF